MLYLSKCVKINNSAPQSRRGGGVSRLRSGCGAVRAEGVVRTLQSGKHPARFYLLISRPEIQRSIMDLEQRLFLAGLLVPRTRAATRSTSRQRSGGARAVSDDFVHPIVRDDRTRIFPGDSSPSKTKSADRSKQKMPRRVVDELKSKLSSSDLRLLRNSFQSMDLRGDTTFADKRPNPQFRMFGDTLLREGKSRSLDNLVGNMVSKDLRGGDLPPSNRYSRLDVSRPFGQTGEFAKSDGLWKPTVRRVSSIRMNL
ncbi:hypothetical protein Y032_0277g1138 [Ancylostoma ceylanicum]|uniref:Uncharacterized protein n=1 Tax=Ancylostoma ceylanicum TaxID=53326 RepID=A0A016S8K7_9BILA|nr:hypothetical protein Y032_0277g1138 [Ancylostoma ceylanicum]